MTGRTGKTDARLALGLLLLAAALLALTSLWVPINPHPRGYGVFYYRADLWTDPTLRALPGTVAALLGLSPGGFVAEILLCQLLWLFLILEGLLRGPMSSGAAGGRSPRKIGAVVMLGSLFAFSSVVSTTNAFGGTIDVVAFALILVAVRFCDTEASAHSKWRLLAAAGFAVLAVLVHEKSVLDIAIVSIWLTWKQGWSRGLTFTLLAGIGTVPSLLLLGGKPTPVPSPTEFAQALSPGSLRWSLNLWGLLLAGGMLWLVLLWCAARFVHPGARGGRRWSWRRGLVVLSMVSLCFLPLLMAIDTSRLVGLIWLPTFLLAREVDLTEEIHGSKPLRVAMPVICLLQLLTPPLFIYKQRALPLSCYAEWALDEMTGEDRELDLPYPLTLQAIERRDITMGNECWPPIRRKRESRRRRPQSDRSEAPLQSVDAELREPAVRDLSVKP